MRFSLAIGMIASLPFAASPIGKSVWDGIYSVPQAERGQVTYRRQCGHCHRDDLKGAEAPALQGPAFFDRWGGESVYELWRTISTKMPKDAPGSLTPQESLDVLSFVFRFNQMPPGNGDLPDDPEQLVGIEIVQKPPSR